MAHGPQRMAAAEYGENKGNEPRGEHGPNRFKVNQLPVCMFPPWAASVSVKFPSRKDLFSGLCSCPSAHSLFNPVKTSELPEPRVSRRASHTNLFPAVDYG